MTEVPPAAVVLAAGMGTRLGELGTRIPKGFLELGTLPIVEESILKLLAAGVPRIVVVTGHLPEPYRGLAARYRGAVELVHNPHFAETGSLHSLACAWATLDEDFLLLESDLVYERRALAACLDQGPDVLLVSGPTRSGDEVWVRAPEGRLEDMSKDRSRLAGEPVGELVGITRISRRLGRALARVADQLRDGRGLTRAHYETEGLVRACRQVPVMVNLVPDLVWAEIDDAAHLARARERVYPAIVAKDGALTRSAGGGSAPGPSSSRRRP